MHIPLPGITSLLRCSLLPANNLLSLPNRGIIPPPPRELSLASPSFSIAPHGSVSVDSHPFYVVRSGLRSTGALSRAPRSIRGRHVELSRRTIGTAVLLGHESSWRGKASSRYSRTLPAATADHGSSSPGHVVHTNTRPLRSQRLCRNCSSSDTLCPTFRPPETLGEVRIACGENVRRLEGVRRDAPEPPCFRLCEVTNREEKVYKYAGRRAGRW